ncbi:MAG: lipid IV(A) 3-deoxy-D-manno-octulosonic acid transferase [Xanthomonadales bacterium]|nr:lipid IV(A) 3-deoxy-D-manno-octulosonic acid transferase [Xanthomonadales bacterium]
MLYSLALYLFTPLFFLYLLFRGWRDRGYWQSWGQRLGFCRKQVHPGGIVVHAVSVGEVNAAEGLIHQLLKRYPNLPVTVTCFTPTGSRRIRALFGAEVAHALWPLDLPGAVRRFLRFTQPKLIIILETEIWPNLYSAADGLGIPLMLVNARISNNSFARYQRFHALTSAALGSADRIGAQSEEDQRRLLMLGAPPDRTLLTGNLKYDLHLAAELPAQGLALRQGWGAERPVWLAASTREGEEEVILEAFQQVLQKFPQALLVMVPRHPERFDEVAGLITGSGLSMLRHSKLGCEMQGVSCYLVDAMGELLRFYAACDLAFVGGSLANTGGHNVLEAAALAKPVLVGPNTFNFAQITERLLASGGALRVIDSASLQQAVVGLLHQPEKAAAMGAAGKNLVLNEQGALERTLDMVSGLLGYSNS